jgi:serine/threonine-protein kinase RsbW
MMRKPGANRKNARPRRLQLTLKSSMESVGQAEAAVVEFARKIGYSEPHLEQIGLAVIEAVANAILHGNRCDVKKKVRVKAAQGEKGLVISVQDEGEGFDADALLDPLSPDTILKDCGRGVFLVRACMDEVAVRRKAPRGTEVKMIKHTSKAHPARATKRT